MAQHHGKSWGKIFSEMIQDLLDGLQVGVSNKLSLFMEQEKARVLGSKPALTLPAIEQPVAAQALVSAVADVVG